MVRFPGLGLAFSIQPVAVNLFGVNLYFYAICIVLGIAVAMILCYQSKEKFGVSFDFVFESLIPAVLIGLIGARIYYMAFNWKNNNLSLFQLFNIRNGGLAIYGGLLTGLIVILIRCKKYKINCLNFLDYVVPFIAIAQSIGRWGNFFNKEAYGTETANLFRMGMMTSNGYQEVHPAFLYESIATLTIFIFLRILQKNRKFKGQIFYFYLFLYGGIRMLIEGIRVDSLMFQNFRISQILSGAIFVVSGIMLLKNGLKWIDKPLKREKLLKKSIKS